LNEVVNTFAVELEVEAGVLEGGRELDYGLSNFVYLFLRRDLVGRGLSIEHMS
jgi:hypothetical protein